MFEKVYNAASQRAGKGIAGKMFLRAADVARDWSKAEQAGEKLPWRGRLAHGFYELVVYKKIRTIFGPNADFAITGGAPMDANLSHFFNGIGMPLLEGYGMTETCGPVCVSLPENNRIGTIGMPMSGVTAGIADDGELCVRGHLVCRGYHNHPDVTAEQIVDGWLHTGDLGDIDEDGFISITGRKKDLIITAGGKNVSPIPMEEEIAKCPIVEHAVVVGDGRPFIGALVTLDPEGLASWLPTIGQPADSSLADAAALPQVREEIQPFVDRANATVSRAESVRKFVVLDAQFTQKNSCLTPSLKVVRPAVNHVFSGAIDQELYAGKR